jgi:hypothetical protein
MEYIMRTTADAYIEFYRRYDAAEQERSGIDPDSWIDYARFLEVVNLSYRRRPETPEEKSRIIYLRQAFFKDDSFVLFTQTGDDPFLPHEVEEYTGMSLDL